MEFPTFWLNQAAEPNPNVSSKKHDVVVVMPRNSTATVWDEIIRAVESLEQGTPAVFHKSYIYYDVRLEGRKISLGRFGHDVSEYVVIGELSEELVPFFSEEELGLILGATRVTLLSGVNNSDHIESMQGLATEVAALRAKIGLC